MKGVVTTLNPNGERGWLMNVAPVGARDVESTPTPTVSVNAVTNAGGAEAFDASQAFNKT